MLWKVLLVIVVAGGLASSMLHRWTARRIRKLLGCRPQLSPEQFASTYFGETCTRAALARRVHNALGEVLGISVSGLHPEDRFVRDLRMDEIDSLLTNEFIKKIELELRTKVPRDVAQRILTVRELIDDLESRVPKDGPPFL